MAKMTTDELISLFAHGLTWANYLMAGRPPFHYGMTSK